jgi:xylulokinase
MESIAFEYAYYLGILRDLIPHLDLIEARVVGGGGRSPLWNQIKADVLGVPYQPLQGSEFAAWGAAMIAGKAAGVFDDLAAVAYEHARPAEAAIQPDAENYRAYQPLVEAYIRWQQLLEEGFGLAG